MKQNLAWEISERNWTPNDLNFMVKAVANCKMLQEEEGCVPGGGCVNCTWSCAVRASDFLDPFTKSRVEDKAHMYITFANASSNYADQLAKQSKRQTVGLIVWVIVSAVLILIAAAVCNSCSTQRCNTSVTGQTNSKWHTLPPAPSIFNVNYYDYKATLNSVMKHLDRYGPDEWFYDGTTDCKDWACSFLDLWYDTYGGVDGSCILVRNVNQKMRMDHLFVAVWSPEAEWIFIEPQACHINDWSLKYFWGNKYDEDCNCYNETRKFLELCDRLTGDFKKRDHLIEVTKVDKTYKRIWWDDTHPIQYHTDKW